MPFRFTFMGFQSGVSWFQEIFARKLFTVFSPPDFHCVPGRADNVVEASKLLEKVPELRHKIIGKFISVEVRTATYLLANLIT